MTLEEANSKAMLALANIRYRLEFLASYHECVSRVAEALIDAASEAEANALSFKSIDVSHYTGEI